MTPEKMTPERDWPRIAAREIQMLKHPPHIGACICLECEKAFAKIILAAYRATQEEDAGKMTFDEWVKRVAAQNPAGLSDIWINAARNGWEAYHQYRASQEGKKL